VVSPYYNKPSQAGIFGQVHLSPHRCLQCAGPDRKRNLGRDDDRTRQGAC
jgi:hypothetical protein